MKKVAIIPLALGVFVGGMAIKLGMDAFEKVKADSAQETLNVVIAATEIPATSAIDRAMITLIETPMTPLTGEDAFGSVEDLIGRVVASSIPRGGVVRSSLLAPDGTPPGLGVRIKKGFRAVSVKVNEVTGVAYQIRPGAFVDVIAVMTLDSGRRKETVSRTILQNVEVGAVGRVLASASDGGGGKGKVANSITLLVKDSDAPLLHLAQTRGKLTLALRSDEDKESTETGHSTESELLGGFDADLNLQPKDPVVEKVVKTKTAHAVTVVHGANVSRHSFGSEPSGSSNSRRTRSNRVEPRVVVPRADGDDDKAESNDAPPEIPG